MTATEALAQSLSWGHERVHVVSDASIGLEAAIAIHSTALGPALGGLRIRRYDEGLAEALDDVLRLSRAMTLKASAAGLDLGGGKAVIVERDDAAPRGERLKATAREIERLGGAYITAADVGTTTADMDLIAEHTSHVVGSGRGGDPSPATARTVFDAIRVALELLDGHPGLRGRRVGVIGLGKTGGRLAKMLVAEGARVIGFDPSPAARQACAGEVELVDHPEAVLGSELDVLAPCALGGLIDLRGADALRCRIVCGSANNPLTGPEVADALARRGVLYVPDFLANCGGLIHVDSLRPGRRRGEEVERRITGAAPRTREVLAEALATGESPAVIAERRAWARVDAARARSHAGSGARR